MADTVSVVIATAFREKTLAQTLEALAKQTQRPDEVIIVDAAPAPGVEQLASRKGAELDFRVIYQRTDRPSAANQRNLGADLAGGSLLWFLDDDAYPEPDCLEKILGVFENDSMKEIGGTGALLSNQHANVPSPRAVKWFQFLAGDKREDFAGGIIGPAVNILPRPTATGAVVPVEWLNSTCTVYRRAAFAAERFGQFFYGYSFMEDVDLSVRIGRHWKLVVHTGARAYHDSQPSRFKRAYRRSKMSVENRYHVMTATLGRNSAGHHFRFFTYVVVSRISSLLRIRRGSELSEQLKVTAGNISGLFCVLYKSVCGRNK